MKKFKTENFVALTDREHILKRPNMYLGSVDLTSQQEYLIEENKIKIENLEYVPGLLKIINEILDNSIDEGTKTNFEFSTKIKINFDDKLGQIIIEDNGRGIPCEENSQGIFIPYLCWGKAKAGNNFSDEDNENKIGMNGVGSFATAVFSNEFIGETCDGTRKAKLIFNENSKEYTCELGKGSKSGTKVSFIPDLKRFKLKKSDVFCKDSIYKKLIYQRLLHLTISFPKIKFYFNDELIKINNIKCVFNLFGEDYENIVEENYLIGVYPSPDDDFRQISYINGLKLSQGGNHIDYITNEIVKIIREKLSKKYKTIKPADIKNKLFLIFYGWKFKNMKFDSQTKERLTNDTKEIKDFLGEIDLEKFANKILKNNKIIEPIIEIFKIKEEFKNRQEIQNLSKNKKKKFSDKYLPPILKNGKNNLKYLFLTEGDSSLGSLSASFGREGCGYIALRGKPLSCFNRTIIEILKNEEFKLILDVLNIDNLHLTESDSENWYEIEINNNKYIVNENDEIKLEDGYYYRVKDLF